MNNQTSTNACKHLNGDAYVKQWPGTLYDPPETTGIFQCGDCGEIMDIQDAPEDAVIEYHDRDEFGL